MDAQIKARIHTLINGITNLTGKVFYGRATDNLSPLYCVYSVTAHLSEKDTENSYDTYWLQFSVFDDDTNPTDAETAAKAVRDALDASEASWAAMTRYTIISIDCVKPVRTIPDPDPLSKYWQAMVEFKLKLQIK